MIEPPKFMPGDKIFYVAWTGRAKSLPPCPTCKRVQFSDDYEEKWEVCEDEIRWVNWTKDGWRYTMHGSIQKLVEEAGWHATETAAIADLERLRVTSPLGP